MKKIISLLAIFSVISAIAFSQTKTTEDLDKRFEDGLSLYFYKNTLKMLNQTDSKEFDELIKDIEKMKFLMIDKTKDKFSSADYKKLLSGYQGEAYEEMMTSRFQGKNFGVYIKEKSGDVKGTVILASDSTNLYVLDIVGKIAINKATDLFKTIDESTDIGGKIKDFMSHDDKKKGKDEDDDH
jgi:Zn-dependent metalloprotease